MESNVAVTFLWDRREHARVAQRLLLDLLRRPLFGLPIAAVIVAWAALLLLDLWRAWTLRSWGALGGIDLLLLILGLAVIWLLSSGLGWLRALRLGRVDPRLAHPMSQLIDDSGIRVETNAGSSFLPWDGMSRIVKTPDCFLWYWHQSAIQYTPKRALSEEDARAVRDLVRKHAAARAALE